MEKKFRGKLDVLAEDLEEVLSNIFTNYSFGKSPCPIDKNGWVYGNLINGKTPYIVGEVVDDFHEGVNLRYWYPVKKVTVGQYTVLKDKNGTEIYEGDIVVDRWANEYTPVFQKGIYMAYNPKNLMQNDPSTQFNVIWKDECEIIGNIHDNPELIEAKKE